MNRVIAFLFFMLFLAGFAFIMLRDLHTRDGTGDSSIVGGEWRLDDKTLAFRTDGTVDGFAGCNQFFGKYVATDETVDIDSLGSTSKACAAPLIIAEHEFLEALERTRAYAIAGPQLTLQDAAGNSITLTRGAESP